VKGCHLFVMLLTNHECVLPNILRSTNTVCPYSGCWACC